MQNDKVLPVSLANFKMLLVIEWFLSEAYLIIVGEAEG